MASFQKENQLVWTQKKSLKEISWFGKPKCNIRFKVTHFFVFFLFFHYSFYPSWSIFVKMENMLWIEDNVERTSTPPIFYQF
jgi:hypothetical protein